ncbi:Uncharacterised protein [Serratia fonticola]|uniref:Uncharacterized protein n=1 Tax=Serratia fonticola TaxID=47917 RepID=A0A4U9WP31_SERFO|nr:Uncharacterised protein [Serratia fonticola]
MSPIYNYGCRGNISVESIYNDKLVTMNANVYFSFLNSHNIIYAISGTATMYNEKNEVIKKQTILRNITIVIELRVLDSILIH